MNIEFAGWTTYKVGMPNALKFVSDNIDKAKLSQACERLVAEDIVKNKYKFSGEHHQYGKCGMPVISVDGQEGVWICSWRSWGELMAAAWNAIEQICKYDYTDFYMNCDYDDIYCCAEEHALVYNNDNEER
jgi:hypothetical protein